jgi:hypothetical protein
MRFKAVVTKIHKNLTPQEVFEYKKSWSGSHQVQVDCDSYYWSKDFCKEHFYKYDWDINRFTKHDDSHTLSFANAKDRELFIQAYQMHNPNFDVHSF